MQSALGTQWTKTSLQPRQSRADLSPQKSDQRAIDSDGEARRDAALVSGTGRLVVCGHGRGVRGPVGDRRSKDNHYQ